jgi:hypothetical protein
MRGQTPPDSGRRRSRGSSLGRLEPAKGEFSEETLAKDFETIWTDGESQSDYIDGIPYDKEIFENTRGAADDGLDFLFEHFFDAQNHLNTNAQRQLDFFYRQVLGFKEKPAVPDKVHVLFELAKQIDSRTLEAGTLLKAGKDSSDKDVI